MSARNRRLPRDLAWPLTLTDIRTAIGPEEAAAAGVDFGARPWGDGTALHVEWVPRLPANYGGGIHPAWWNTVRIGVSPLPAGERAAARRVLRESALPELAEWIGAARRESETWRLSRHSRSWRPEGEGAVHRDDGRPYR
ncbi:hypothetical protein [Streptomyces rubellomurinus]|uniref:hypothetical protein n=1 Tax=Streptomyces rubellomurinus (strain ATCC 31215) TaxID=359131 RepID=UPI0005F25A2D|nr:hypothetical protein [Streptomyces rubellomurinus]